MSYPGQLIRILVADDHPVTRFGVRSMMLKQPAFEVVGEAEDGEMAIRYTRELQPDILLLDLQMPRLPGLEALQEVMRGSPQVKTILLTSTITAQQIIEALQIGARGIVQKSSAVHELPHSLIAVMSGDYWIGGKRVGNLLQELDKLTHNLPSLPGRKTYGLTPRELEATQCIVEGYSNKDIARQFVISEDTVKRHLSNIFDKTGVSTRLELAMFAIAHKLIVFETV